MSRDAWLSAQISDFQSLQGARILNWSGNEMALDDGPDGYSPIWRDVDADALQFKTLQVVTDEHIVAVTTSQSYDGFGLCCIVGEQSALDLSLAADPRSIYRDVAVSSLPVGQVGRVSVTLSDYRSDVEEVIIDIGGHRVSLRAAEFDLQLDGSYRLMVIGEAVLVQIDRRHPEQRT